MRKFLLLGVITFYVLTVHAQVWHERVNKSGVRFEKIKNEMREYFDSQPRSKSGKIAGYKQYKRWEHYMSYHLDENGIIVNPARSHFEKQNYLKNLGNKKSVKSSGDWTLLGPTSASQLLEGLGRIDCAAIDPNNDSIIFAGSPTGGLWKTTNKGISWNPCSDHFTSIGISSIVINPQNTNIIYIATGDRDGGIIYSTGVYKSIDGGTSFQPTGLQFDYSNSYARSYKLMLHPNNPDIIYLASSEGFFVSNDKGENWDKALVQSSNGNISNYEIKDFRFKPNNPNTIYAVQNNNFYISTNGGSLFTNYIPIGLENLSNKNTRIDIVEKNPENVYLLIEESFLGQIYKSEDSGVSFTLLSGHPNIGSQTHYNLVLEINPENPNEIYAGGQYLYKSLDEGITWERAFSFTVESSNYSHPDFHFLEFHNNTLINGNDGGIYISPDGSNTWNNISNGLNITQFYRLGISQTDDELILAGAQDNGTSRYTSGIWKKVLGADGMEAIIDYSNPNIMYYSYQHGGILRSNDGGNSASNINGGITETGASWITPYVLHPTNPEIIYAAYSNLWKSTNRGDTWIKMSDHTDMYQKWIAVAPSNTDYIYMTNGPTLFKTTDGCTSWKQIYIEKQATCIVVSPTNPENIWITYSGYLDGEKVFMSEDAGSSFINVSGSLPNVPINNIVYQNGSNDGLYIGTAIGVFYKDNTMNDWIPFNSGLPGVFISELEIQYQSNKLKAATFGRGLWETPLYFHDTEAPSAPTNLNSSNVLSTSLQLTWSATTDNIKVTGYDVFNGNSIEKTVTDTFTTITGLSPGTSYTFSVKAKDGAGNKSVASNDITVTMENGAVEEPVYCNAQSTSSAYEHISRVQFGDIDNSSSGSGYGDYSYLSTTINTGESTQLFITTSGSYTNDELVVYIDYNHDADFTNPGEEVFYTSDAGTAQTYTANITPPAGISTDEAIMRIILFDSIYNSKTSCGDFKYGEVEDYTINIRGKDTIAPTAPKNLSYSNITETSVELIWNTSTDNTGVVEYNIFTNNTLNASSTDTSTTITGLIAGTVYFFNVIAKDSTGNISPASNEISITTDNKNDGAPNYCAAKSNNTSYEHITRVEFGDIDQSSASEGYEDHSSLSTSIIPGVPTPLSITTYGNYTNDELVVYIDYNNNGDFSDSGEEVYYNSDAKIAQTYTTNINTPLESANRKVRMRIILYDTIYNAKATCGDFNYGEVEDYSLNIISAASVPQLNSQEEELDFFLYPNPNKGSFTISFNENFIGWVFLEISNMNGQLISKDKFKKITTVFEKAINLNIEPGIYNVKLIIGKECFTKSMVVE